MSDNPQRNSEQKPAGNVWLVLVLVTAAVLVSAFLFGNNARSLRYPDLMALLKLSATDQAAATSSTPDTGAAPETLSPADADENGTDQADSDQADSDPAPVDSADGDADAAATKPADDAAKPTDGGEVAAAGDSDKANADDPDGDADSVAREAAKTDSVAGPPVPTLVVTSKKNPEIQIEYSDPQDIEVSDESITGTVMYRSLGVGGTNPKEPAKRVEFQTIRDTLNEAEHERLVAYLDASGVTWDNARPSRFLQDHWPELLMIGIFVVLGVVMLRRIGGVGSPMSFSRSRGKLYSQEELGLSFADTAGIDEAVEEVREIVDFLKNSEKYQSLGGRIPKGVLLVGPPGTGKTLLAKAIAGEAGVPFFSLSGSDFVEMYVGVGAARVRDMFQQATNRAPCIIFIDELDALGKSRSGSAVGGHDEREQTLNALLVEMDGFVSNSGVIVIAATNRPETLDPALLRPGRFDRHVLVDRPDVGGREAILKVHVKNVKLDEQVDLKEIASITPGFVGADLANLVNEAALLAARAEKRAVSIDQFNEAVERVTAGLEKKNRVMNADEKIRVAYHEAGHAIVAAALPNTDPVHKVSIIPRGLAALGYTMQRPESERYLMTKTELESNMKVLLAGTLTEEMTFQDISTGAQNDLERCTEIARSMVMDYGMSRLGRINLRRSNRSAFLAGGGEGYQTMHSEEMAKMIDKEVTRIIDDSLTQTREILEQRRDVLEAVTQRLLEVEAIDNDELMRLIRENSRGPWLVPGTVNEKPLAKLRPDDRSNTNQDLADRG
ncbi:ATP-dependent zinc metalloprotease FtsH 4 [Rubripirellula lacrimiformis]|uniref:ATP-dependent zinc metalloprotease FtsH n=1 Tax=Rubripirellula lacrimiformis TaxID=1930273 RepID=A0A517NL92_9BACT|nr:ATP-dependent zinc metalloprotease FtsH [Rubripirellula lacrimiformis]QDT07891.1 ATP-dependent zinc metalloprotease FtsH 4 [Rubripirellula lacrimiformis]